MGGQGHLDGSEKLMRYLDVGFYVGCAVAVVSFLSGWIYAISSWGFFLGVAFGWLPAALVAIILGGLAWIGWGLLAAILGISVVGGLLMWVLSLTGQG